MRFVPRVNDENPNLLVGIFLLILLAVFMGPNIMPRLLTTISPIIDEAIPCAWLRQSLDRANHQSLIGRQTTNGIELEVRASDVPADPNGALSIDVVVINRSLGTVPILYAPNQVNFGDNGTSGLGLIFTNSTLTQDTGRADAPSYAEQNIRQLGPRQRCIHSIELRGNQLNEVRQGGVEVRAYYRINAPGAVPQPAAGPTPIYPDQGMNVVAGGFVQSAAVPLIIQVNTQ